MYEEKKEKFEQVNTDPQNAEEYVETVKALKESTVSKEEYEKLQKEKATLIKAIAEGATLPDSEKQKEKPNLEELRKKFLSAGENNLSNAEYIKTVLELRKTCLEEGQPDPFLPLGIKRKPDNSDLEGAQKVAEAFEEMLAEATDPDTGEVDNDIFNALLKKNIANDSPILNAKLRSRK